MSAEDIELQPLRGNEYYKSIFKKIDTNNDNVISYGELCDFLVNDKTHTISPSKVQEILSKSDKNKDGNLQYDEFLEMINNPENKWLFGKYVKAYIDFVVPRRPRWGDDEPDLKYDDQYSCCPPVLGMVLISTIAIALFAYDEAAQKDSTLTATGPIATKLIFDPNKKVEAWRYITYMFVHIGYLHLVVNLAVQLMVGFPLEMVHGWWRIQVIYFAGVVSGSLATAVTDPYTKLGGASGGVYSLITAHLATIVMNWSEMTLPFVHFLIFALLIVFDFGTAVYNRYTDQLDETVGYVAHLAGAISGLLVGITVLRNLKVTRKEHFIWWIAVIVYVILIITGIVLNICLCL